MTIAAGTLLRDGRYIVVGTLGEGTQATTLDAIDRREGRAVAIKRFDVRGARAWKDVELAEREARVLGSLAHPQLPAYVEHFESEGALYLVMEKIEGESLAALRKRGASVGEEDVVRLLRDAATVLDYLHRRAPPVIHRDLKPSNVLRRPDGSFAFVDFGAVRDRMKVEGGSTVVGTFGYMAPEQFQGRALPGSDVYAIGATALAVLTGAQPEELPHRGLRIDVADALRGRVSPPLIAVLNEMLEPDPDRRPQRIAPLLARLDQKTYAGAGEWSQRSEREQREQRESRRLSRREARRAARRARREQRGSRGGGRARHGPHLLPWPLRVVVLLGLGVARVAVGLALGLVVPTLLSLLSLFFGRALQTAAERVAEAGDAAARGIGRAQAFVRAALYSYAARVRVEGADDADASEPRTRVSDDAVEPTEEREEHEEHEAEDRNRRGRR